MKISLLFSLLAGLTVPAGVFAQTLQTYDAVFGLPTPLPVGAPNFPLTLTVPEFDSNLGTLDAVNLTLTSTIAGSVSVVNFTGTAQPFNNAFSSMTITVTGPAGTAVSVSPEVAVGSGSANPGVFVITNFGNLTNTASNTVSASTLSPYEAAGGGTLNLTVDSSGYGNYGGSAVNSGTVGFGGSASASGDVEIVYTYFSIPEPASYAALFGLAALGFVIARRKRVHSLVS